MHILILFAVINLTAASPKENAKLPKLRSFTFPRPLQISDDQLIIKDVSTFVHNRSLPAGNSTFSNGTSTMVRSGPGDRLALRLTPWYKESFNSTEYHLKLLDMMKHCIYSTQDRLKHLTGLLDKYKDDAGFRMGFIFDKLDQLLVDMRRIYTYALNQLHQKRIQEQIIFYRHLSKRNVDVTYIVEFAKDYHESIMEKLAKYNSFFATDIIND